MVGAIIDIAEICEVKIRRLPSAGRDDEAAPRYLQTILVLLQYSILFNTELAWNRISMARSADSEYTAYGGGVLAGEMLPTTCTDAQ